MQRLREEVRQLKQSVELVTNTTPENLVERILTYATRPLSEFNKYEVVEMLEILHNKATDGDHDKKKYYRLVYQTVREKVDSSKDHFKDLVMRLLGDKDHERVLDIVCKVEKLNRKNSREMEVPGWHVLHAFSTCDAIFVIGGVILRLTVPIGSPVVPNRLPNQTSRLCSDRTGVITFDRHCVLYVFFLQNKLVSFVC